MEVFSIRHQNLALYFNNRIAWYRVLTKDPTSGEKISQARELAGVIGNETVILRQCAESKYKESSRSLMGMLILRTKIIVISFCDPFGKGIRVK